MEGIYTNEAPELGACCVVGAQCTQQLRLLSPKAGRTLEKNLDRMPLSASTPPGMESHFQGLSPMFMEQQVLGASFFSY